MAILTFMYVFFFVNSSASRQMLSSYLLFPFPTPSLKFKNDLKDC